LCFFALFTTQTPEHINSESFLFIGRNFAQRHFNFYCPAFSCRNFLVLIVLFFLLEMSQFRVIYSVL
jgi:hypothetical protein